MSQNQPPTSRLNRENMDTSQWLEQYGNLMYRYTLVRVKNEDAAEEIVQTTFLAALQAKDTFAGRSSEKSWLFGILKHKIMDHFREIKKFKSFDLSSDDDPDPYENNFDPTGRWKEPPANWALDPQKAAENQQLRETLVACLDGLSEKFRHLFVLKEIEGLSTEAICKEFNIQPTNLWVMLHRTRNKLKKCLEARWFNKG